MMATTAKTWTSKRAIPRLKKHPVLKEKCSPPLITLLRYTWADREVGTYFSQYNHELDLVNLLSWLSISIITDPELCSISLCIIRTNATSSTEFVFMNREGMNRDFFYMYDCLFRGLHVRVPFDNFAMGVLLIFNVAPMQLHPNGWVAMQAFHVLCLYSFVSAMPRLFLHYFYNHPQDKARWISLIWLPKHPLFHLFTSSYKIFKIGYFKATTRPIAGKDYFYDLEGILCFPSIDNNVLNSTTSTQRSY